LCCTGWCHGAALFVAAVDTEKAGQGDTGNDFELPLRGARNVCSEQSPRKQEQYSCEDAQEYSRGKQVRLVGREGVSLHPPPFLLLARLASKLSQLINSAPPPQCPHSSKSPTYYHPKQASSQLPAHLSCIASVPAVSTKG
jgi:hypothetical protein